MIQDGLALYTYIHGMRATITQSHSVQSGVVKQPKGAIDLVVINQAIYIRVAILALFYPAALN